jgi:Fur family transcriptional regulator, ferric uptake regulator
VSADRDRLSEAGIRPTRQRVAIVDAVSRERRPVTAQELHRRLNRRRRGPGLATVYRTLGALAEAGVLTTFPAGEEELAYRLCDPGHHHHLICERCGTIVEIPSCEVEEWAAQVARRRGFSSTWHQADIFGLCERCRERS